MNKNNWKTLSSPYMALSLCLLVSFPLFFLRGIGVFDDSVFLKIGELILNGLVPYRDVFDNKPPGIYYLGAAIAAIGNSHWLAPRIFLFVFAAVFGVWVIRYTSKYWGSLAAYLVAWIFGLSYTIAQGYSFHTDQFCAFFGFAAIAAISGERRHVKSSWLLCGISISIALLFKQVAVIYLAAIIFAQLAASLAKKLSWQSLFSRCIMLISGFAIIPGIVVAVILWNGIWQDFYDAVFISIPVAQKSINLSDTFNLWIKVPSIWLAIACFLILIIDKKLRLLLQKNDYFSELLLLIVVGVLSVLPTLSQVSNTHYTGASLVFMAIISSIILSSYFQLNKSRLNYKKSQLLFISIITSILLTYTFGIIWGGTMMISQNRLSIDLAQMHEIRSVLNLYLSSTDKILTLSDNAARIYYMSGRIPLIKYIYYYGSGWLNSKIPSLDDSAKLLASGTAPGAIIEMPLNQEQPLNNYKKYQVIEPSNSINLVQQTRTIILIRGDLYEKKL
ncbi:glycosyltransferase family 39 protein [Nostoc sp. UHCC 0702]|nr:glycosyltransferase family 39 protein [Nostoc sp. UHCC 0702]